MKATSITEGVARVTTQLEAESVHIRVRNWAALSGRWTFGEAAAIYNGPVEPVRPYGIALSDIQLRDGTVRAKISFEKMEDTTGGIVLGFQSEAAGYTMCQLGAYNSAYAISEFEPGQGWRALVSAGSISNLHPVRPYSLEIKQQGQRIIMVVDTVPIFEQVLSKPLPGNQVGLFAWGSHSIKFEGISAQRERPRAFVAMPFVEPFDTLYREVIKQGAEDLGFEVVRIDEIAGPGIIFEDIKREIAESRVVIAEITAPNQNVFYELGYAHALNKPTILLAQRGKGLPFDIRSYRVIFYEDTIGGKPIVERDLRKHLHSILKNL